MEFMKEKEISKGLIVVIAMTIMILLIQIPLIILKLTNLWDVAWWSVFVPIYVLGSCEILIVLVGLLISIFAKRGKQ